MFDIIKTQLEGGILVFPSILILLMVFAYLIFRIVHSLSSPSDKTGEEEFEQLLRDAGYSYDPSQDIFCARMDAWQRKYGYCRLYDEAAAPAGIIIDAEPVHFEYGGKRWMLEFWKGQYGLNTGCEIGVYNTEEPDFIIPNLFSGAFYKCVDNANRLMLEYTLYKNGNQLFQRKGKHWWLAGFKPGLFSEPSELTMRIQVVFHDAGMCRSFIRAMKRIGYKEHEIRTNGITAEFLFDKPHTPQPLSRTEETDWIIQRNNERLCDRFQEITRDCGNWPEKLSAILEEEPLLYEAVVNVGKTRKIFKAFEKLKSYL
jgi:hypothetical protein